jgi:hypothetical protein
LDRLEQVDARMAHLNAMRDEIKDELRQLAAERDELVTAALARARVEAMTDEERVAMAEALGLPPAQVINPRSIPTALKFGDIGAK